MEFIKKYGKWIGLGAILLTIIGCLLPFAQVTGVVQNDSISYVEGDGIFVLILMVISAILLLLKKNIASLVFTIISFIILIVDAVNVSKYFVSFGSLAKIGYGVGFYFVLFGLIITLVMTILIFISNKISK